MQSICYAPECDRPSKNAGLCGMHYQRMWKHGNFGLPPRKPQAWATCTIDGCSKPSRTVLGTLCEMHYYRMRRSGSFDDPVEKPWSVTSHGYEVKKIKSHPTCGSNGLTYRHRMVLYDVIGPGAHCCHWCGTEIEWFAKGKRKLVVDHVDANKRNNDASNLVASCHPCNANRGLFMNWVMRHRDDPFLLGLFRQANAHPPSR